MIPRSSESRWRKSTAGQHGSPGVGLGFSRQLLQKEDKH
jgi:hypothetical protein